MPQFSRQTVNVGSVPRLAVSPPDYTGELITQAVTKLGLEYDKQNKAAKTKEDKSRAMTDADDIERSSRNNEIELNDKARETGNYGGLIEQVLEYRRTLVANYSEGESSAYGFQLQSSTNRGIDLAISRASNEVTNYNTRTRSAAMDAAFNVEVGIDIVREGGVGALLAAGDEKIEDVIAIGGDRVKVTDRNKDWVESSLVGLIHSLVVSGDDPQAAFDLLYSEEYQDILPDPVKEKLLTYIGVYSSNYFKRKDHKLSIANYEWTKTTNDSLDAGIPPEQLIAANEADITTPKELRDLRYQTILELSGMVPGKPGETLKLIGDTSAFIMVEAGQQITIMNSSSSDEDEVDQSYGRLIDLTSEMNRSWISFQAQVAKGQLSEYDIKYNTLVFSNNLRVLLEATGQKSGIISWEPGAGQAGIKLTDQVLEFVDAAERGDHVWNPAESRLYAVTLMHYFTSRGLHGIENNVSPEQAQQHITEALELANSAAYKLNHPNATEAEIESVTSTLSKPSQPARKATRDQIVSVLKETAPDKGTRDLAIHAGFTDSEYSRMIDEARPIMDIAGATGEGVAAFGEVNLAGEQEDVGLTDNILQGIQEFSDEYVKSELGKLFSSDDQINLEGLEVFAESEQAKQAFEDMDSLSTDIVDAIISAGNIPTDVYGALVDTTALIGEAASESMRDIPIKVGRSVESAGETVRGAGIAASENFLKFGNFVESSMKSLGIVSSMVKNKLELAYGDSVTDKPSLWWPENLRTEEERGLDIEKIPEAEQAEISKISEDETPIKAAEKMYDILEEGFTIKFDGVGAMSPAGFGNAAYITNTIVDILGSVGNALNPFSDKKSPEELNEIRIHLEKREADKRKKEALDMTPVMGEGDTVEKRLLSFEGENRDENGNHVAYMDGVPTEGYPNGRLTVGHGHLVVPGDNIVEGQTISDERADELFKADVASARIQAEYITKNFKSLPIEAQEVIIEMVFQMGRGFEHERDEDGNITKKGRGVKSFENMRKALDKSPPDFDTAADEMLDSDWARIHSPSRAKKLAKRMRDLS
jgi:hypothetical protein